MEKHIELPTVAPGAPQAPRAPRSSVWRGIVAAVCVVAGLHFAFNGNTNVRQIGQLVGLSDDVESFVAKCVQPEPLIPSRRDPKLHKAFKYLFTEEFANASTGRLQDAVRVRTESFDDLGAIGEDKRWDVFYNFYDYLKDAFPVIHEKLQVEHVNTHGLLYTWKGADENLKPTLLMAHQDTVPVPDATLGLWTYPPFDGVFDGTSVWGRGASDCKNQLTAIMETVELLLRADFKPQRTLILSFGFDEECSGPQGAGHLAPYLLDRYGKDGLEVVLDEGLGYAKEFGRGFAVPGVAEKGYIDVEITVRTPGGHSSVPADHTSIGILSEIITKIEAEHYDTFLDAANPYLAFLQCGAAHAPDFPKKLRKLLHAHESPQTCSARAHDPLALEAARLGGPAVRYLMQTSQAVDLIAGGAKVNALPESAAAIVNHRVNIGESPAHVRAHLARLVGRVARAHGLNVSVFDESDVPPPPKAVTLRARPNALDPAPVTPSANASAASTPYGVLAGTVRSVFGEEFVVAPALMTGNTDTRYFWDLTRHIFRFAPGSVGQEEGMGNVHTVDEHISVANHINTVKWFMMFIRNMDEADIKE